ncbi:CP2C8 protein, partial [Spizaetus tyrannus]|nr:CP2C8 protein [Spizaetus tyrannus]
ILLILVVMALVAGWKKEWQSQNYPPGPLALPVIGNLLQLRAANTCKTFRKLSKKYGPVFTLHFGSERAVVVFGYEVVREVLLSRGDEFTDRGRFPLTEKYNKDLGIFMSNGEMWAQTRRFTLTTLRDFGMGKRSVEEWVQEEMGLLLQELAQTKGQPFNPAMLLSAAVGNTICRILFGERFGYGDEEY